MSQQLVSQLAADPDFMGLPDEEKRKVMVVRDPVFGRLPPDQQRAVVLQAFKRAGGAGAAAAARLAARGTSAAAVKAGAAAPMPEPPDLMSGLSADDDTSSITDAGRGFRETTIDPIRAMGEQGSDALMHPSHDPVLAGAGYVAGPVGQAVLQTGRGIFEGAQSESERAIELAKQGEYSKAAGHGAAAVLPVLGPTTADIVEGITTPGHIAESLGKAAGMVVPALVSHGMSKIPDIPALNPLPGEAHGLPGLIERTTAGSVPFSEFRDAQFETAMDNWKRAKSELEGHSRKVLDEAQRGYRDFHERTIASGKAAAEALAGKPDLQPADAAGIAASDVLERKAAAQQLYADVDTAVTPTKKTVQVPTTRESAVLGADGKPLRSSTTEARTTLEGGVRVDITPVQKIAARYIEMIDAKSGLIDPKLLGPLRDQLDALVAADPKTTYAAAAGAASDLLDTARKLDEPLQNLRGKINNDLSVALKQSIDASVEGASPAVVESLRKANKTWGQIHAPAVQDFLELAERNPERAHTVLIKPSTTAADVAALRKVMSPESFKALSAMNLRDIIDDVTSRSATPHTSPLLGEITAYEEFSGPKLLDRLDKLRQAGTLGELFPKPTVDLLTDLANDEMNSKNPTAESINAQSRGRGQALDAQRPERAKFTPKSALASTAFNQLLKALGVGGGAGAGLFLSHGSNLVAVAGASIGYVAGNVGLSALARMMLDPSGANKILRTVRAISRGARDSGVLIQQVGQQLAREQARDRKKAAGGGVAAAGSGSGPAPVAPMPASSMPIPPPAPLYQPGAVLDQARSRMGGAP